MSHALSTDAAAERFCCRCTLWNHCKHHEGKDPFHDRTATCEHADFHGCHRLDDDGLWSVRRSQDEQLWTKAAEGQHCPKCGTQLLKPRHRKEAQMTPREYAARNRDVRSEVLTRDDHTCQVCGRNDSQGRHHILPRAKGGHDTPDNLICTCRWCEHAIHAEDLPGAPFGENMTRAQVYNICLLRETRLLGRTSQSERTFHEDFVARRMLPKKDPSKAGRRIGLLFDSYARDPWEEEQTFPCHELQCDVTFRTWKDVDPQSKSRGIDPTEE